MPYAGSAQNKADKAKWQRKWRRIHKSEVRQNWEKYEANHDMKAYKRQYQLAKYKMTIEDYDILFKLQNGICAVCKQPPIIEPLVVDHNHNTGKVRGLLHRQCNSALGLFKENSIILRNAAEYLENALEK